MYIHPEKDRADAMCTGFLTSGLIPAVSHLPASYMSSYFPHISNLEELVLL